MCTEEYVPLNQVENEVDESSVPSSKRTYFFNLPLLPKKGII